MNRHRTLIWFAFSIATAAFVTSASAQYPTPDVPKTEPEYIAKAKTAAPESIVNEATIVMPQEQGDPKTLQTGSNGFTCLVISDGRQHAPMRTAWNGCRRSARRRLRPTRPGSYT